MELTKFERMELALFRIQSWACSSEDEDANVHDFMMKIWDESTDALNYTETDPKTAKTRMNTA